jgi:DNA processing protein
VVTGAADIFEALNLYYQSEPKTEINYQAATEAEKIILKILTSSPLQIDKIIQHCTLETSVINATLVQMELKGWIKNVGGQNYIKN